MKPKCAQLTLNFIDPFICSQDRRRKMMFHHRIIGLYDSYILLPFSSNGSFEKHRFHNLKKDTHTFPELRVQSNPTHKFRRKHTWWAKAKKVEEYLKTTEKKRSTVAT
mmetsp:Transcript_37091/g.43145  ORF Transcript_37091/g.43145 Transcript_37091/m.43145 type:complete len:108 (-) Transcript_37091:43-366(-)